MTRPRLDVAASHALFLQEFLFRRRVIDVPAVEGLYAGSHDESVHLDYKAGDFATPPPGSHKKFANELAKWLAAFANSVGGLIVVGVAEIKSGDRVIGHKLDPIRGMSRDQVEGAVTHAFGKLHPNLPRAHRYEVLDHPEGLLLVAGVDRADHLVPVVEFSDLAYYLRIGTSTRQAPVYLAQDLVLGRRQRTSFRVEVLKLGYEADVETGSRAVRRLSFIVRLTNVGLVWMERPRVGVLTPADEKFGERVPPELLAANVRVREGRGVEVPRLARLDLRPSRGHVTSEGQTRILGSEPLPLVDSLGPMDIAYAGVHHHRAVRVFPQTEGWHAAALFVVSAGQPPVWYQLLFVMHPHYDDGIRCWLGRCDGGPPFVGRSEEFPTEVGEHLTKAQPQWTVRFGHADTVEQGLGRDDRS